MCALTTIPVTQSKGTSVIDNVVRDNVVRDNVVRDNVVRDSLQCHNFLKSTLLNTFNVLYII